MIGIELEKGFLDLAENARINLIIKNPLITDEVTMSPGSYSFPFSVAGPEVSGTNAQLMDHPDVVRNYRGSNKLSAKLWFDGIRYKTGKLSFKEIGRTAQSNFTFGLSQLSDEIKNKKIREIIDEEIVISSTPISKYIYAKPGTAAVAPYSLSVNGSSFQGASLSALVSAINASVDVNAVATLITSGTTPNGLAQPFIRLNASAGPGDPLGVINVTSEENGNVAAGFIWLFEGFDMTAYYAQFQSFIDQYNTGIPVNNKIRFPVLFNLNKYGNNSKAILENGIFSQLVNGVTGTGIVENEIDYTQGRNVAFFTINTNTLQPFVMMKHVLDKIANFLGTSYEGDVYDDVDFTNMLIYNSNPLDEPMDFIGRVKFVFWHRSFNLASLVPDLTISSFFKALQDRYNIGVLYNEKINKIMLQFREPVVKSRSYEDITRKIGRIDPVYDDRVKGVLLRAKRDDKDKFNQFDNQLLIGDEAELTIESGCAGLGGDQSNNLYEYPVVSQIHDESFSFRVFHYEGMQLSPGSFYYPKASSDGVNFTEKYADQTSSPFLPGLYSKFWQRWIFGRMNRKRIKVDWEAYFKNVHALDPTLKKRVNDVNYIWKSVEFEMTNRSIDIQNVKIELVTV